MRRILTVLVLLAALAAAPAARAWIWPAAGPVIRPFSLGPNAYAGGQHRGVDIAAEPGSPVLAPVAGTVSFVGSVPGGGRAITIQTPDGYAVTLLQLAATSVERGSVVEEGTPVGVAGESSDAVTQAPHVHLGIRVAADPDGYVDPLGVLPPLEPEPVPLAPEPEAPVPVARTDETPVTAAPLPEPTVVTPAAAPASGVTGESQATEVRAPLPEDVASVQGVANAVSAVTLPPVVEPVTVPSPATEAAPAPAPAAARAPSAVRPAPAPGRKVARTAVLPIEAAPAAKQVAPTAPKPSVGRRGVRPAAPVQPRGDVASVRDAPPRQAAERAAGTGTRREFPPGLAFVGFAALAGVAALAYRRRPGAGDPARIMGGDDRSPPAEDPGRGRLAVCERTAAHRPRGGLRRPVGHLRPVPPTAGQRRPDGERHRRARHAGDGGRGRGRSLAA